MFRLGWSSAFVRMCYGLLIVSGVFGFERSAHAKAPDAGMPDGGEIFLPGTQPRELTKELRPPLLCAGCHSGYADYAANDTWQGTMMANAARDPLFHAALTVANQDIPGSGDLCIRCHSPRAWLFGRSSPPVISNFEKDDFEGVDCDFCHRLTPDDKGEALIGTGQYMVADDFVRRGPIQNPKAPHEWKYEPYTSESKLCGICHDVSNPLNGGFAIERTYSEWLASAFSQEGKSCQSCHMPEQDGAACGAPGMPTRKVHRHELAGGNYWMPKVIAAEFPELNRGQAFERTVANAEKMLQNSALLTITAPGITKPEQEVEFVVRVENLTGHKLPTGYPEGRRSWLEVKAIAEDGTVLLHSGAYDFETATRAEDPQLRTFEVRMAANGKEGFHFILQDELLQDTRIPPRGFIPASDTRPLGREYPVVSQTAKGPILAHWDEAHYRFSVPSTLAHNVKISASLRYQTTSREYIEALRDANVTDSSGERLYALWQQHGRAEPFVMASATAALQIGDFVDDVVSDAGVPDAASELDAGQNDASIVTTRDLRTSGGCSCSSAIRPQSQFGQSAFWAVTSIAALAIFRGFRKRRKTQCELGRE